MTFTTSMEQAANRHYQDAVKLLGDKRYDNAGYHFGLAAECAIKQALLAAGVRDDDKALWLHFPELTAFALQAIQSRRATAIRALIERANFMERWKIRMRYSPTGMVNERQCETWRRDANASLGALYGN